MEKLVDPFRRRLPIEGAWDFPELFGADSRAPPNLTDVCDSEERASICCILGTPCIGCGAKEEYVLENLGR